MQPQVPEFAAEILIGGEGYRNEPSGAIHFSRNLEGLGPRTRGLGVDAQSFRRI